MRKEYYLYITIIILFVIWFFYYNRPLHTHWLTDPWEEYFVLPERTLPSSWKIAEQDSSTDREPTTIDEKLFKLDEILQQYHRQNWEPNYTYSKTTTGWIIEELYFDNLTSLFNSWDNKEVIQYHINNFARYMSWYELYPPQLDFTTAIPRFTNHQSIFRVGSLYTALLCYEGKQKECHDNFSTLFQFSQQMKNAWSLVSLLIGIVEEWIVMNHIEYLYQSNPTQYQFLITMLQWQPYINAEKSFHNVFISEYLIAKNEIHRMPMNLLEAYDLISVVNSNDERDPTWLVISILKTLRIPIKWLFDIPETLSLARSLYYKEITDPYIPDSEWNDDNIIDRYRPSWHPLTRKNIIGYHFLNATIPRLTGIQGRALDQEKRFNNLINQQ